MTDIADTAAQTESAAQNLFRIMAELSEAQADVALLERLKGAQARVTKLTAEQEAAVTTQNKALHAEEKAKESARFVGFQGINVVDKGADKDVLSSTFEITYTRLTWDMDANASRPTPHTVSGFSGLPSLAFQYLLERHPDKIPDKIMRLAPGDPSAAFGRYFDGMRRGYLTGSLV
jgi:hypothetical protein